MSNKRRIAEILEDILDRQVALEDKVDMVLASVGRLEAAVVEVSREVRRVELRLIEEAEIRAGLGEIVLDHEVGLAMIRGGAGG